MEKQEKKQLVWVLAEVSDLNKENDQKNTIIVEPIGYRAMPYYAHLDNVKPFNTKEK